MEENFRIIVDATQRDGRMYLNIQQPTDGSFTILPMESIRPLLAGALAMAIRASKDEGKAMKETIQYLNDEFVDTNSFSDLSLRKFGNE
jgi:alpha-L-fucosidase